MLSSFDKSARNRLEVKDSLTLRFLIASVSLLSNSTDLMLFDASTASVPPNNSKPFFLAISLDTMITGGGVVPSVHAFEMTIVSSQKSSERKNFRTLRFFVQV